MGVYMQTYKSNIIRITKNYNFLTEITRKIKEKPLSLLTDHLWDDIRQTLGLLLKFFLFFFPGKIVCEYIFLTKIIKVTHQNKIPLATSQLYPA